MLTTDLQTVTALFLWQHSSFIILVMPWVLTLLNRCCGNYQIKFWIPVQLQDDDYNTKCIMLIPKCPSYALLPTIHNACELPAKYDSPSLCDATQRPWTRTPFAQYTPDTPLTFPSPIVSVTGNCHVSSLIEMIHFPSLEPIIHSLQHIMVTNPTDTHPLCHVYRAFKLRHLHFVQQN